MGKRKLNPRRVKQNRNYEIGEIVGLFGVHKNTVAAWRKDGLQPTDGRKPALFHGATLAAYLELRRTKGKRPLRPGQIYCLPCREPKEPGSAWRNICR